MLNQIRAVIADDDSASLRLLEIFTNMINNVNLVGKAVDGDELKKVIEETKPDLAIVDINMPGMSGFKAIEESLKHQPDLLVIFVTGIGKYAVDAFKIRAVDYIVKPVNLKKLEDAVQLANDRLFVKKERKRDEEIIKKGENNGSENLVIKDSKYAILRLPFDTIIYIEKEKNAKKVSIYTENQQYITNETVSTLFEMLDDRFVRVQRSIIINTQKVKEIIPVTKKKNTTYQVKFKNIDNSIMASRNHITDVVEQMNKQEQIIDEYE